MSTTRNRFIFVAALPKSASSLTWLIVSALQEANGRADPDKVQGILPNPFAPLSIRALRSFPSGGVYKCHSPITWPTDDLLRVLNCKYIVVLRHPADFITALYCHILASKTSTPRLSAWMAADVDELTSMGLIEAGEASVHWPGPWDHILSPVDRRIADCGTSIDDALAHLLADGQLFKAMEWMTDWLKYRDQERSAVVTYEELMRDFDRTVDRLCRFVRSEGANDDLMGYLRHVKQHTHDEGTGKRAAYYPRGWTGHVGIWKSYFSEANVSLYNQIVEKFIACYPHAESLLVTYPDLALASAEGHSDDPGSKSE